MHLEHLCDADFSYSLLDEVEQSARGDGQFFGQGTATFTGRLAGTAQWANYPRVSAGYAHPDARGRIQSPDGGIVLFELHGLSNLDDGAGIHVMTFKTAHGAFLWLNDVMALGEGSVDVELQALRMRYYECIVTHRPGVPANPPDEATTVGRS